MKLDLKAEVPGVGTVAIIGTIDQEEDAGPGPYAAIASWLDAIDAGELERVALERMAMGSGSFTSEVLDVLRGWASGTP